MQKNYGMVSITVVIKKLSGKRKCVACEQPRVVEVCRYKMFSSHGTAAFQLANLNSIVMPRLFLDVKSWENFFKEEFLLHFRDQEKVQVEA